MDAEERFVASSCGFAAAADRGAADGQYYSSTISWGALRGPDADGVAVGTVQAVESVPAGAPRGSSGGRGRSWCPWSEDLPGDRRGRARRIVVDPPEGCWS